MSAAPTRPAPTRERLLHSLYEASELEHNLMCTYLYAAFSLRDGDPDLSADEQRAVEGWRQVITRVAIEEMAHLAAVWNITAALGGAPRFGRGNFPLDPGYLPAGVVVKLAPFDEATLQHFIHLERPRDSQEQDGDGFTPTPFRTRNSNRVRLTPMAVDYDTVGEFYATLEADLRAFVAQVGESTAFCGDPALQLSEAEVGLSGLKPVLCLKTALAAFDAIVAQGEGAPAQSDQSHYQRFIAIRDEYTRLKRQNPDFKPAFPAATNPVLRPPVRPEGRVWLEDTEAIATVDIANAGYALMLRLLAYSYSVARPHPHRTAAIELSVAVMRAVAVLGEHAAGLPAGPSNPHCHAGVSFTALRDAASLPVGASAARFFTERFMELSQAAHELATRTPAPRTERAARLLAELSARAERQFAEAPPPAPPQPTSTASPLPTRISLPLAPVPELVDGVEHIAGEKLTLIYEGKKCIHARFCVTYGPRVFLANVQGPWIHPDAMDVEGVVRIAHDCPSGAIRYQRKDGASDEQPPPVNLLAIREAGPYAVRGDLTLAGQPAGFRATLCRCGASKNKPFCDGSHHDVAFSASGEPSTGKTDMLEVRDGPLQIEPELDGPLSVRGNLEITSGTGRVVARLTQARLCRCGGSSNKPFCDGTHARIGFRS